MVLKQKAADNYRVALTAYDAKQYDAAASRIYYAFYQACVGELNEKGKTLQDFDAALAGKKAESGREHEWPHTTVATRCTKSLGLDEKQQDIVTQARSMREKGDYNDIDRVQKYDVDDIFHHARDILIDLGVAI